MENENFTNNEHMAGFHAGDNKPSGCYECYREVRLIKAKRTVDSGLTNEALTRNSFGSNYPTGFNPNYND